jgi:hypothetical protein
MTFRSRVFCWPLALALSGLLACVDPTEPPYDYLDEITFIDGQVITVPGRSEIKLTRGEFNGRSYLNLPIEGAEVSFLPGTGAPVPLTEVFPGIYQPADSTFAGRVGEEYRLDIRLPDGRHVASEPVVVPDSVPIANLYTEFDPEGFFDDGSNRFLPAHNILIDYQDPAGEENFYRWTYNTWMEALVCETCEGGVYRNGECVPRSRFTNFDYACDVPCWNYDPNSRPRIFSDEFGDGSLQTSQLAGQIVYNSIRPILIEVEQFSVTETAFNYSELIEQLTTGAGGLNAAPPAALVGNLFNVADDQDLILGNFLAAGLSVRRLFLRRDDVGIAPVNPIPPPRYEPLGPPLLNVPKAPCVEGPNRTRIKPAGWPN